MDKYNIDIDAEVKRRFEQLAEDKERKERRELRDQFAMAALQGLLADPKYDYDGAYMDAADDAYRYARAMLKAREAGREESDD